MYIVDELLSPLITPFVLYFKLRPRALDIVNFFRQFTIEVSGRVCAHSCVHACMFVCACVSMCVYVFGVCVCMRVNVCVCVLEFVCACMSMCVYVFGVCVCVYLCM